jgi:hypothetical protein
MTFAVRCRVCQSESGQGANWFLLVENDFEDRLKILSWSETLASCEQVYAVCCPAHVQKLVTHWMATGSLDYPLVRAPEAPMRASDWLGRGVAQPDRVRELGKVEQLGDLAVDRDSVHRLLLEDPDSLGPVLDALMIALTKNAAGDFAGFSLATDDAQGSGFVYLRSARTL